MKRTGLYLLLSLCFAALQAIPATAYAQPVTTIQLSGVPSGRVAAGTVVTLTTQVADVSGPVLAGEVAFFDGNTSLATVPVVRVGSGGYTPGTATLSRVFAPGGHSIRAVFIGTTSEQTSSSTVSSLTVGTSSVTPSSTLVYNNTRYFGQLTELEDQDVRDIDNDGVLDLVVPQFDFANIAVSLGDVSQPGAFLSATYPSVPFAKLNNYVTVGDLNGDGLPDIVVVDTDNHLAVVLFQDPAHRGSFLPSQNIGPAEAKAVIADFNHDGIPDILLSPGDPGAFLSTRLAVYFGSATTPGSFGIPTIIALGDGEIRSIASSDMNGDGLPDIVLGNYYKQTVAILLNDASHPGQFLPRVDYPAATVFSMAVGDLNGDGLPDVAVGGLFSGVSVLLNDHAHPGQLLAPANYVVSATPAGGRSLGVAIGDVNGDGIPDIASGNEGPVFDLFLGRGDGTFNSSLPYTTGPTPDTFQGKSISIADVDGDGLGDVLVGEFAQNAIQVFTHQSPIPERVITATDIIAYSSVVQSGNPIVITYKVSSAIGAPPGALTLYDSFGGATFTQVGVATLDSSGTATFTESNPSAGSHDFIAHFHGDSVYAPSTSIITNVVVVPRPTIQLTVTAAPNPAAVGQPVVFTARATASGPAPTGTVVFLDGFSAIGSATLVGNTATFTTARLIPGTHSIYAEYTGDSNYGAQSAIVTVVIQGLTATESLVSSSNPSAFGQNVTFTAAVNGSGPAATGQVTFQDGSTQLATVQLGTSGSATFSTAALTAGTHSIKASYSGDSHYSPATASLGQIVSAPSSATDLTTSGNPVYPTQSVGLRAVVSAAAGGSPTGTVTFYDGGTALGSVALDPSGTATITTSFSQLGTHPITAVYSGTATLSASTSAVFAELVVPNPADYTLSFDQPLTLKTEHNGDAVLTITPSGNFADTISVTCGEPPIYATCQVKSAPLSVSNNTSHTMVIHIDTDEVLGYAGLRLRSTAALAFFVPCICLLPLTRRSRPRMFLVLLSAITISAISGCTGKLPRATPPGSYNIEFHGHGASSGIDHTATLRLVVAQ